MKWSVRAGKKGDMVRVHCNSQMDHYGVYISDEEVIQFGLNPMLRADVDVSEIKVLATDINEFRNGAFPEFADLSFSEKLKRFKIEKIVSVARSKIGEDGYNIIFNNCEHFAYECIFGVKYSSQAEKAKDVVKQMATGAAPAKDGSN